VKLVAPTLAEIKDATLKMEVEHAKRVGLPLRVAEANNIRLLERSEQIAKAAKPKAKKQKARPAAVDAKGVTRRAVAASPIAVPRTPPCKHCGICRLCRRMKRALAIIHRRKESPALDALALRMFVSALQAQTQIGKFKGLTKRDADRALVVEIESICDASVKHLGAWL
jgi:hypothetical protein